MEAGVRSEETTKEAERILEAIEGLSKKDLFRVIQVARASVFGTEFGDPSAVINEAVVRALEGSRRWPGEGVPFAAFLVMTARSIANASRKAPEQLRTESIDAVVMDAGVAASSAWGAVVESPEEIQIELEDAAERARNVAMDVEKIGQHFERDQRVRLLMSYLSNGKSAEEIRAELRWSETEYATVRKRWRRGIGKLFKGRKKR